jgi:hypothetical protein
MREPRFTLASPEVIAVLSGVHRSTKKSYYRIVDGRHVSCPVKIELMALGIAGATASKLLQTADLPSAPFIFNRQTARPRVVASREVETEIEVTVEVYEAAIESPGEEELGATAPNCETQQAEPTPETVTEKPIKKNGPKPLTEEEREAKVAKAEEKARKQRYQLVQQGSYWGCYDTQDATVVLFKTLGEAEEHLQDILRGRDGYRISYGGMGNRSRSREAMEVHY